MNDPKGGAIFSVRADGEEEAVDGGDDEEEGIEYML